MAKKILIADDSEFMRNMIRTILVEAGYQVVGEAVNGLETVKMYREIRPDMAIVDIDMPEIRGISVVKQILSFDPQANIIMCSARKEFLREAIAAGAKGFIAKPFKASHLFEALAKVK